MRAVLESQGFTVVSYTDAKGCVDFVARRGDDLILVRVLGNVDALREDSAHEFVRLAAVLRAYPVIVGTHTKRGPLEDGVIYWRYGIPVMTIETFSSALSGEYPLAEEFRGRRIVFVDPAELRRRREELGLTLHQLADLVGTTKESIYRYERGQPLQEAVALRLEKVLKTKLRIGINPFRVPEEKETPSERFPALSRYFRLSVFRRTPWDAVAGRTLILSEFRGNVYRRAELLRRGKSIVASYVALYAERGERERVAGVPVLTREDLESVDSKKDVLRLLREKDEEG